MLVAVCPAPARGEAAPHTARTPPWRPPPHLRLTPPAQPPQRPAVRGRGLASGGGRGLDPPANEERDRRAGRRGRCARAYKRGGGGGLGERRVRALPAGGAAMAGALGRKAMEYLRSKDFRDYLMR